LVLAQSLLTMTVKSCVYYQVQNIDMNAPEQSLSLSKDGTTFVLPGEISITYHMSDSESLLKQMEVYEDDVLLDTINLGNVTDKEGEYVPGENGTYTFILIYKSNYC